MRDTPTAIIAGIDIENESLLPLADAGALPALRRPNGMPAHINSVRRYVEQGARAANGTRIKLEAVKTPRGWMTSSEAVARLISRLTCPEQPSLPTPKRRAKEIDDTHKQLVELGMV